MIHSASSSSSTAASNAIATTSHTPPKGVSRGPKDQIHIDKAAALRDGLQQVPEIRPEVVARARALANDPSYPSADIIRHISATIVNSPDLSEDQS
jgi:hypothetical protein